MLHHPVLQLAGRGLVLVVVDMVVHVLLVLTPALLEAWQAAAASTPRAHGPDEASYYRPVSIYLRDGGERVSGAMTGLSVPRDHELVLRPLLPLLLAAARGEGPEGGAAEAEAMAVVGSGAWAAAPPPSRRAGGQHPQRRRRGRRSAAAAAERAAATSGWTGRQP